MTMDRNWRRRAACVDEDPELFFPVSEVGRGARQVNQAKAVCARCPVRERCLNAALDAGWTGVWGGTTETERTKLRRGRRPAA